MKKFNLKMVATVMICGSFLFSSCIGSFGLHSKLVSWNQGIGTKFVNELVYLAFNIIPDMAFAIWPMHWSSTPSNSGVVQTLWPALVM